jgi:hypothetical protein
LAVNTEATPAEAMNTEAPPGMSITIGTKFLEAIGFTVRRLCKINKKNYLIEFTETPHTQTLNLQRQTASQDNSPPPQQFFQKKFGDNKKLLTFVVYYFTNTRTR